MPPSVTRWIEGVVMVCGPPRAARAAILADIERAVVAEHAGIRRAGGVGKAARLALSVDRGELAAIAFDEDDAAVGKHRRPLRPAEALGGKLCGCLTSGHHVLPAARVFCQPILFGLGLGHDSGPEMFTPQGGNWFGVKKLSERSG